MSGGTWVPKAQQNCTWRIFNKVYKCRHSVFHARSVEDIEFFGTPSSGDSEFDKTMLNETRLFYKTPAQMIDLFKKDVPVGLFNTSDATEIYTDISDHLRNWYDAFSRSPNIKPDNEIIDDLMLMDRFANVIYPHATPFFKTDFVESTLVRRMTEMGGGLDLPMVAPPPPKPKRESMAEIFANRREIASKSWRG
jgi:hypothetical protein